MIPYPVHKLDHRQECTECHGAGCVFCDYLGYYPPGWYFYDEIWVDRLGPFATFEEADEAFREYCQNL